jgi:hypothetical protein
MGQTKLGRGTLGVLVALVALTAAALSASDRTPEETVRRYLTAIREQDFSSAFDLVSTAMKTDRKTGVVKSREVWVKESQYLVQLSALKIFGFRVFAGRVEGEEAKVPNLLSSQDKFLNQLGVDEHELYTLVREDGEWKVDRQEIVIDRAELDTWFAEPAKTPTIVP